MLAFAVVAFGSTAFAQIGDRQDRKGEVQQSLVPPEQIPPAPALSPADALKTFRLQPGFKLELAAAEPLVQDPVAIAFGPDGRMWVVEMRGYMPDLDGNGEDAPVGRVVVLRDTDADGRYDQQTVFLDRLVLPRAILPVADGALVGAPPELVFWRDTNGDGRADEKTVVASDYGVRVDPKRPYLANPERAPNSLLWAHDNWIYSAAYTKKFRYVNGRWETAPTMFRGQWGLSQDDFGRLYHGSNSDQLRVDLIFSDYLDRNPNFPRLAGTNVNAAVDQLVWPARVTPGINRGYRADMLRDGRLKEFTAACAMFIYRGDLLQELQGNAFVAEPAAHFVRRNVFVPASGTVRAKNACERDEFLTSTDERFRPVNFATGPDGALYIVDLYRGVLQHRISLTSYLRKQSEDRKLNDPQHLGRIYRIVPAERPVTRAASYGPFTAAQWVERLAHPNVFWRDAAQRTLVEKRDASVAPAIRKLAADASALAAGRVQALWSLHGLDALDRASVLAGLEANEPIVRAAALRTGEKLLGDPASRAELLAPMQARLGDESDAVRLQAVLTLGEARDAETDSLAARVVLAQPSNVYLRDAFFSGLRGREVAVLERLAAGTNAGDAEANKLLGGLARGVFGSRDPAAIERVIKLAAAQPANARERVSALLEGMVSGAGPARRPIAFAREPAGWAKFAKDPAHTARLTRLAQHVAWPGKPGGLSTVSVRPLDAGQQKRFEAGKALYTAICSTCHQVSGSGLEGLAPPLADSEWVLGSEERLVRIVLHGLRGQIRVLGKTHMGDMPALGAALDDTQIASVLTYLRREWGHAASPVEPEKVRAIRAATKGQTDQWSSGELEEIK